MTIQLLYFVDIKKHEPKFNNFVYFCQIDYFIQKIFKRNNLVKNLNFINKLHNKVTILD